MITLIIMYPVHWYMKKKRKNDFSLFRQNGLFSLKKVLFFRSSKAPRIKI